MPSFTSQELLATTSIDDSPESYNERKHYQDKRLPFEIFKGSYALPQVLLSSALFAVVGSTVKVNGKLVARPRPTIVNRAIAAYGGGQVVFSGQELHQDDKRVFMALLHPEVPAPASPWCVTST